MPKKKIKKDSFNAIIAFILSLGFWIPLFNIGLSLVSVYLAIKSLRLIRSDSKKYGGFGFSIAALVISLTTLAGSLVFAFVYTFRTVTCDTI